MQDHRVQVRDQVWALVTCALARMALPAPQPSAWGSLKPHTCVETYDSSWANGGAPAPEWSRSSFIVTRPVHVATSLGGPASSLAEMQDRRHRWCVSLSSYSRMSQLNRKGTSGVQIFHRALRLP